MRRLPTILLLAVFAMTSCERYHSLFHQGHLSIVEQQSISNSFPGFAGWRDFAEYSATWGRGRATRHVCLYAGAGSIIEPYEVFVFDADGHVVEANVMEAPSGAWPVSVSSISPLRVKFTGGAMEEGKTVEIGCAYSHEDGRKRVVEDSGETQRTQAAYAAWEHSGSTNYETLRQMLEDALTNSAK